MADNTRFSAGTDDGATFADDDIGGVKYPRHKLSLGADGSATDALGGAGAVAAGVQRVTLASDDPGVAAMEAVQAAVEGTLTVDASGAAVPVTDNGGALTVDGTVAVTHAALTELGAAIDTEVQCDIVGALPAGDNNIGNVDVVSSALPTGAATSAKQDTAQTSLSNIEASASVMDDWDNAASDGASVSGDVAHDAADAGEPVKIGGRADTTFQTAVADGDRVAALFDVYGVQAVRNDHPNKWSYHDDDASAVTTDGTVQSAPGAGLSVYITDVILSIGAATASSIFLEESTTKILGPYYLEAIAGRSIHIRFATPKKCTANTAILVTNTGSVAFAIDILGFIAP